MDWARQQGYIVITHDLDFGTLLATTQAKGPSVVQVRTQAVSPQHLRDLIVSTIQRFSGILGEGALISVDERRAKTRILPLRS